MVTFKELINRLITKLGYTIIASSNLRKLELEKERLKLIQNWVEKSTNPSITSEAIALIAQNRSVSQLQQDVVARFVEKIAEEKSTFFVEFGATDGITINNTFVLERYFGWSGILSEPSRKWQSDLAKNRKCRIDYRCVWNNTGEVVEFQEMESPEFSTISTFRDDLKKEFAGRFLDNYFVETVTLLDLLDQHKAPRIIGYLSIDTEGSEYEILRDFDFEEYVFNFISIEHNFGKNREKIHELLRKNGYVRVLEELSKWDDWFVPEGLSHHFEGNS